MAYIAYMYALPLSACAKLERVQISIGPLTIRATPTEAAELTRQIAAAIEQLAATELHNRRSGMVSGDIEPDSLPPITPPVALSDAEMAEGDLTEELR